MSKGKEKPQHITSFSKGSGVTLQRSDIQQYSFALRGVVVPYIDQQLFAYETSSRLSPRPIVIRVQTSSRSTNQPIELHSRTTKLRGYILCRQRASRDTPIREDYLTEEFAQVGSIVRIHRKGGDNLYWSMGEPIQVLKSTYIGHRADLYRFTHRPIQVHTVRLLKTARLLSIKHLLTSTYSPP